MGRPRSVIEPIGAVSADLPLNWGHQIGLKRIGFGTSQEGRGIGENLKVT